MAEVSTSRDLITEDEKKNPKNTSSTHEEEQPKKARLSPKKLNELKRKLANRKKMRNRRKRNKKVLKNPTHPPKTRSTNKKPKKSLPQLTEKRNTHTISSTSLLSQDSCHPDAINIDTKSETKSISITQSVTQTHSLSSCASTDQSTEKHQSTPETPSESEVLNDDNAPNNVETNTNYRCRFIMSVIGNCILGLLLCGMIFLYRKSNKELNSRNKELNTLLYQWQTKHMTKCRDLFVKEYKAYEKTFNYGLEYFIRVYCKEEFTNEERLILKTENWKNYVVDKNIPEYMVLSKFPEDLSDFNGRYKLFDIISDQPIYKIDNKEKYLYQQKLNIKMLCWGVHGIRDQYAVTVEWKGSEDCNHPADIDATMKARYFRKKELESQIDIQAPKNFSKKQK